MKTLQQRIVQFPRDARPLADPLFQANIEFLRDLTEPIVDKRTTPKEELAATHDIRNHHVCQYSRLNFEAIAVSGPFHSPSLLLATTPKTIRPGAKVRVNGFSGCNWLTPATVETFEKISKPNPPGHREAQPRVLKRDSPGRWRNSNGAGEVYGVVIGGDRLDVRQRGN